MENGNLYSWRYFSRQAKIILARVLGYNEYCFIRKQTKHACGLCVRNSLIAGVGESRSLRVKVLF